MTLVLGTLSRRLSRQIRIRIGAFARCESGLSALEYAVLAAGTAVLAIGGMQAMTSNVDGLFSGVQQIVAAMAGN